MQIDRGAEELEATVPGGTLAAQRLGYGEAALLLHGLPASRSISASLPRSSAVAASRRSLPAARRAAVDVEGPFDVERHAADAVAVLDAARVDRAWPVGHSAGGYLALRVATRFPERVSGVLAIGTLGVVGDGGAGQLGPNILSRLDEATRAELAELEAREEAGTATEEDALRGFALAWPGYFADPANAPACPRDIRLSEAGHLETVASIERDAERVASAVARCAVPVVFLHGSADPIDFEGSARATAAVMPRAKVIVLPGVGHFAWLEQPGSAAGAFAALP